MFRRTESAPGDALWTHVDPSGLLVLTPFAQDMLIINVYQQWSVVITPWFVTKPMDSSPIRTTATSSDSHAWLAVGDSLGLLILLAAILALLISVDGLLSNQVLSRMNECYSLSIEPIHLRSSWFTFDYHNSVLPFVEEVMRTVPGTLTQKLTSTRFESASRISAFKSCGRCISTSCQWNARIRYSPQGLRPRCSAELNEGQNYGQPGCVVRPMIPLLPGLSRAASESTASHTTESNRRRTTKYLRT